MNEILRVGVVGAGRMGSDHIVRLQNRMKNVRVAAVVDIDEPKAQAAIEGIEGAKVFTDFTEALDSGEVDAVMVATPGFLHEQVLLPALAKGFSVFCEKPLTPDSESAWRVVEAEESMGKRLIQVGFMRRFDQGYRTIRSAVRSGEHGELLALDCEHINPGVPDDYTGRNLIDDTVVHEFDIVRYLTGEEVTSVEVRACKSSSRAKEGLVDPAQVLMETESGIRVSVSTHVTAEYGYAVTTRAVFERNHLEEGVDQVTPGFEERFVDAYDTEIQEWIDGCLAGEVAGPDAWDGYAAAAGCETGLEAIADPGTSVDVKLKPKPDLYR